MNKLSRLRLARLEAGKSQWDVTKETGIAQSLVSLYERDLREPTQSHKKVLAGLYGKEEKELWK